MASALALTFSSPVAAYISADADRKCPIVWPRSSTSAFSHPPYASAWDGSPAVTRNMWSSRSLSRLIM
jgi:hypothetical protein